jgi:poly-gamma-glutamate capsule biosynthesis protein CapA/YwtB (metallophosphatase superfamily)
VHVLVFVLGVCGVLGCARPVEDAYDYSVIVRVSDESGAPIEGARIELDGHFVLTDRNGEAELPGLLGPVTTIISGDGHLAEPIVVDRTDSERKQPVEVRLFSRDGGGAPRWSMHVGGDAMLARRYLEPEAGLPLLPAHDIGGGARAVVADLAPAFAIADLATVNLECVVGDLPDSAIYPAKRFILRTPPEALAGLEALSVDLVTLGNNHVRDYREEGVEATIAALEDIDMPFAGVSDGADVDANPTIVEPRSGVRVAVFSYTTVDGDFVNDSYAAEDVAVPPECEQTPGPAECFMYEARSWGCEGESVTIPTATRRIGAAWKAYAELEDTMSPADRVACWESAYAIYPELQDWTARRGHGGASAWDDDATPLDITAATDDNDVVVVQLHAGFQFQSAPSDNVKRLARISIDAGADIVIAHHPHVLQGAEWYDGKLILYSLGNFVFEQDFLVTFASAFLRTVWEGSTLLEARLIPLELVAYQPKLTAGLAAERNALMLWESSVTPATTARDSLSDVRPFYDTAIDPGTEVAHLRSRHHDAVIGKVAPSVEDIVVELDGVGDIASIDFPGLVHARAGGADVLIGRELLGWGHLEDAIADAVAMPAAHWFMPQASRFDPVLRLDTNAADGFGWIEMYRSDALAGDTFARPIARIPVPEHRLYHDDNGVSVPADGEATYTIRMHAKLRGMGEPYVRLEFFWFDDTDPTEDPLTVPIGEPLDLPFDVEPDDEWHVVDIDVDPSVLHHGEYRANVVLVRVRFAPPEQGESVFGFDNFEFIEWRPATQMQDHFGVYQYLRDPAGNSGTLTLQGMPLRDR